MSSLWNRSGTIERYGDDLKADGARATFFQGGTTTPFVVYRDSGESSAFGAEVVADSKGRWPDVFIPYITSYDVLVRSKEGVQLTFTEKVPNPDPVELTVTVDPANTVQTGMIHCELINTTKTGYVRLNGRTIGNAASNSIGAERNHADTLNLFTYLWNNLPDSIAPVSGGRTASASADFGLNKTITLPNMQGATPRGLDDMGATPGNFFTGLTFDIGNATTPGSSGGANSQTITIANMPVHSHTGTTASEGAHTHTGTTGDQSADHSHSGTTGSGTPHTHTDNLSIDSGGTHTHQLFGFPTNTNAAFNAGNPNLTATINGAYGTTADYVIGAHTTLQPTHARSDGGTGHTHTISGIIQDESSHTHTFTTGGVSSNHTHSFTTGVGSLHSHTFTTDAQGSGTPFNNMGRSVLVTWFIKL